MSRYIDADALAYQLLTIDRQFESMSDWCLQVLDAQPTVDVVEVKHGEWVLNHPSQLWECTNCYEREIRTTNFCPNCGADMRGKDDDN